MTKNNKKLPVETKIESCSFIAEAATFDESTAQALIELSKASQAHAQALSDISKAFNVGGGVIHRGIQINGD